MATTLRSYVDSAYLSSEANSTASYRQKPIALCDLDHRNGIAGGRRDGCRKSAEVRAQESRHQRVRLFTQTGSLNAPHPHREEADDAGLRWSSLAADWLPRAPATGRKSTELENDGTSQDCCRRLRPFAVAAACSPPPDGRKTPMTRWDASRKPSRRQGMTEASLYERLGGAFAIAAVVDHFSEAVVRNPIVGQTSENHALREWHTNNLGRLPGLKFMRALWVCDVAGGPSTMQPRNRAVLLSAWKKPIANSRSLPPSSTKSRLNLGERSTSSRCPSGRRRRFWLHLPRTRAR